MIAEPDICQKCRCFPCECRPLFAAAHGWAPRIRAARERSSDAVAVEREAILRGVIAVHMANVADMVADPNGPYPACKNALGTWLCERCGRDVRNTTDACPTIPREKRWRFRSAAGAAEGGRDSASERSAAQVPNAPAQRPITNMEPPQYDMIDVENAARLDAELKLAKLLDSYCASETGDLRELLQQCREKLVTQKAEIEFLEKVATTRMESLNTVSAERDEYAKCIDQGALKCAWAASAREFESWLATLQLPGADPLPLWVCEKMKSAWDASAKRVPK